MSTVTTTNTPAVKTVNSILFSDGMQKRIEEVLGGDSKKDFVAAVVNLMNQAPALKDCDPSSVLNGALKAAILKLQLDPQFAQAFLIPYDVSYKDADGQWKKKKVAQFQIGHKGIKQLCVRSGLFEQMNQVPVYAGQLKNFDPLKGIYEFDWNVVASGEPIAYAAYFRVRTQDAVFEKTLVMNVAQLNEHGKKYSKPFKAGKGLWVENFPAAALKTVSKLLLNGGEAPMSIEYKKAIKADGKVIVDPVNEVYDDVEHIDHTLYKSGENQEQGQPGEIDFSSNM